MDLGIHCFSSLIFIGLCITTASSLQCHVCSTANPGEEDCMAIAETNTKYLTNCTSPNNQSCRIQQQWVDFEVLKQSHETRIIRQCASIAYDADKPCYYRTGFGGKVNVCNCIGDGCNEASKTVSTFLMTVALLIIVKLFS